MRFSVALPEKCCIMWCCALLRIIAHYFEYQLKIVDEYLFRAKICCNIVSDVKNDKSTILSSLSDMVTQTEPPLTRLPNSFSFMKDWGEVLLKVCRLVFRSNLSVNNI